MYKKKDTDDKGIKKLREQFENAKSVPVEEMINRYISSLKTKCRGIKKTPKIFIRRGRE